MCGRGHPSLCPDDPGAPAHCLQPPAPIPRPFPICPSDSISFPETSPCPHCVVPSHRCWGVAALPYQLSPSLSRFLSRLSLQLPADRVRQVRPVLRAPGPPSTSNQIPALPRRPPQSLPGRLFCDLTVAPWPPSVPFICDLVCCSGELTHPGVTTVNSCAPVWYCSRPYL